MVAHKLTESEEADAKPDSRKDKVTLVRKLDKMKRNLSKQLLAVAFALICAVNLGSPAYAGEHKATAHASHGSSQHASTGGHTAKTGSDKGGAKGSKGGSKGSKDGSDGGGSGKDGGSDSNDSFGKVLDIIKNVTTH